MVRFIAAILLLSSLSLSWAGGYKEGKQGPPGQSIVGPSGDDGGGLHGLVGTYASYDATKVMSLNGGVAKDTKNGGTLVFGLIGFKIGESPQDREITRLNARLAALEHVEKPIRGVIRGKN